ncbi:MAG TPA: hypothetical protein VLF67_02595, partial [Candidatus Saccharimonas sp.]|nr:hypothetical protein [Candidatus Saccharimonas sp.]
MRDPLKIWPTREVLLPSTDSGAYEEFLSDTRVEQVLAVINRGGRASLTPPCARNTVSRLLAVVRLGKNVIAGDWLYLTVVNELVIDRPKLVVAVGQDDYVGPSTSAMLPTFTPAQAVDLVESLVKELKEIPGL